MAVNKQDCLILLYDLKDQGVDCSETIKELISQQIDLLDAIKFISKHKELDCRNFYEKMRQSYNQKHSQLYKNIVREELEPKDVLTCLASLNLQILLYNKQVENNAIFLRQMRFEEIQRVMLNYAKTGDIIPCQKLLQLFKADLKCLEDINKKRKEEE